jgi:hypothetical protein
MFGLFKKEVSVLVQISLLSFKFLRKGTLWPSSKPLKDTLVVDGLLLILEKGMFTNLLERIFSLLRLLESPSFSLRPRRALNILTFWTFFVWKISFFLESIEILLVFRSCLRSLQEWTAKDLGWKNLYFWLNTIFRFLPVGFKDFLMVMVVFPQVSIYLVLLGLHSTWCSNCSWRLSKVHMMCSSCKLFLFS